MSAFKTTTCKTLKENLAHYSLLEILHHEVGNGLAVITGYTHLLQRAALPSAHQNHETCAFYLSTIKQREAQLNDFLTQIRKLALQPPDTRFCQTLTTTDLSFLVQQTLERLTPLYPRKPIATHLPTQAYYITCDAPWIDLVLEHVLSHNMAFHSGSSPIHITLEYHEASSPLSCEARMGIHIIMRRTKRRAVAKTDLFGSWSQTLDQRDQDVCMALCHDILQEHGGRLWSEQEQERAFSMYIALPLLVARDIPPPHIASSSTSITQASLHLRNM